MTALRLFCLTRRLLERLAPMPGLQMSVSRPLGVALSAVITGNLVAVAGTRHVRSSLYSQCAVALVAVAIALFLPPGPHQSHRAARYRSPAVAASPQSPNEATGPHNAEPRTRSLQSASTEPHTGELQTAGLPTPEASKWPQAAPQQPSTWHHVRHAVCSPWLWVIALVAALTAGTLSAFLTLSQQYLAPAGYTSATAGWLIALATMFGTLGSGMVTRAADQVPLCHSLDRLDQVCLACLWHSH